MTTPLWVHGKLDPYYAGQAACLTSTGRVNEIYFDDTLEALEACQAICVRCPVFRDCTRYCLRNDLEFGIFAGLTPEVRRRIRAGKAKYYDWRQAWNRRHWNERRAAKRLREQYREGKRKRDKSKEGMLPCPLCGQQDGVYRNGRKTHNIGPDRQRYHCRSCNRNFQGEEL